MYLPHIDSWWESASDGLRNVLLTSLGDIDPSHPILFLATSDKPTSSLEKSCKVLFEKFYEVKNPNEVIFSFFKF